MNNPLFILSLFLLVCSANLYSFSAVGRMKDLDKKVTNIQEQQEQIIQLIESTKPLNLREMLQKSK